MIYYLISAFFKNYKIIWSFGTIEGIVSLLAN